ncbi:Ig-like domain-containing protein [Roseisolibacter sp. H3M3-2]|uniref:InlB B-repeat-containing protein n=1 Tax=Roseisolibacter sp. H3M3-2 TaxID=3031323 RepID=UPI0023D9C3D3|nr:Ig-like domain-containing protein [Roseisolibacter sp. H3M3-2]MDF1504480.1 Ig-like domain-containing protein [Roseisolibacter sp. H3M3-2]
MRSLRFLAAALLLAGCGGAADLLSPGGRGPLPARLAISAQLPALQQTGTASLRVAATYERADGSQAPLATQTFPLTDARTQDVPVPVDLGPCLGDAQRRGGGAEQTCTVRLTLTLLLDARTLDESTLGPLVLQPGVTVATPTAVTLYEVRTVRVTPPAAAVTRPDGSIRLEVGATSAVTAQALDPSGAALPGRAAVWRTSNAAAATVAAGADAATATVTGVAPGTTRVTATVNGREASLDYTVVPRTSVITVASGGTGSGSVVSTPAGIDCRIVAGATQGACSSAFPGDVSVTLQAVRQGGSAFVGWGDACAGAAAADRCTLAADQARTARATFVPERTVSVSNAGDGAGLIGSVPGGIACRFGPEPSGTCSAAFAEGTSVTFTAGATAPDAFLGWVGACEGSTSATCTITVGATGGAVGARFARPQSLTVDVGGTGEGTVSGGPIACARSNDVTGGTCTATASGAAPITLTATPAPTSTFAGWTGACSGTGTCVVTLDRARGVGATFTRRQVTLTVAVSGAGAGTVAAAGQECTLGAGAGSQSCALRVDVGRAVSLSAAPATGSQFGTWSGACASSGATPGCTVTLAADASVGATFVPGAVRVTVGGDANTTGGGGVSGGPSQPAIACAIAGANATGACDGLVQIGATVTLTAAPDANSTFGSWTGACAGTAGPTCTFTARAAASVGVRFLRRQAQLTVGVGGSGAGTVTLNGAPFCTLGPTQGTTTCQRLVDVGGSVTLALQPAAGVSATWGGPCANVPVSSP